MQWGHIHKSLRDAQTENPENERIKVVARRVSKFIRRRTKARHRAFRAANMHLDIQERLANYKLLGQALDENWKIVALDCEWTAKRVISEIGVTVYQDGKTDAYNICVGPGGKAFLHGTTRYLQDHQAREWLDEILENTQLFIGQAFKNDIQQLRRWRYAMPQLPVIDTAKWSKVIFPPNEMSLSKLAKKYDVECSGAHCGGNDALMTLRVALAMYEQVSRPMVTDETT